MRLHFHAALIADTFRIYFRKQNKTPQFFATIHQNWLPDARKFTYGLKWLRPHEKMMIWNDKKAHLECGLKKWCTLSHLGPQHDFAPRCLHMNRNWLNFQGKLVLPLQTISYKRTKTFEKKRWILSTVVCVLDMRAIATSRWPML